jgi:inosine/xanthosine triphosphatase
MASGARSSSVPLYVRKKELETFLSGYAKPWRIHEINDIYGPREIMDNAEALVLSEETLANGKVLNDDRKARGIQPLELIVVPLVASFNGTKISASEILKGQYARNGRSDVPDIVVGSVNPVKVEAVRTVMEKIFGNVRITAVEVDTGVPEQPFEEQTREGAVNRAKGALGMHDLSVGIEAGVFETEDGLYDYQYCAVLDRDGKITIGTGMGFRYPDKISDLVRKGYTVGHAVHEIYGDSEIGKKQGAIGLLSKGLVDRKSLTEQSLSAAMVPRLWDE